MSAVLPPVRADLLPLNSPLAAYAMPIFTLLVAATTASAATALPATPLAQEKPALFKKHPVPYTRFATDVEPYGDHDQDGKDDLLVSSAAFFGPGQVQILSGVDGRPLVTSSDFDTRWNFGFATSTLDDIDADGVLDFAVSALKNLPTDTSYGGRVGVYSGATGQRLWLYEEPSATSELPGFDLDSVGDLNGDGVRDLLVGCPRASVLMPFAGAVLILSGADGSTLRRIDGTIDNGAMGTTVSQLDDINVDGVQDYLVGVSGAGGVSGFRGGEVRIYSGSNDQVLRRVLGRRDGLGIGTHCDDVGDVDGDGLSDFVMNSGFSNPFAAFDRIIVVSSGTSTVLMTVLRTAPDASISLSRRAEGVGDANGDGRPDIAYAIHSTSSSQSSTKLRVVDALTGDLVYESEDLGQAVGGNFGLISRAGDLNGDGRDDVVYCIPDYTMHGPWTGALLTYLSPAP